MNKSLIWYKGGGWIDCRRTPDGPPNMVQDIREFVEARFNRELCDIPELSRICDLLGGHVFVCVLEGANESKRKFTTATMTLINPEELEDPSEEVIRLLDEVKEYLGGTKVSFNSVKVKIKYTIE